MVFDQESAVITTFSSLHFLVFTNDLLSRMWLHGAQGEESICSGGAYGFLL